MTDQQNDSSTKTPVEVAVEHVVETFVYAPIGLIFEGASLLPQLIEKGRNQVTMARMLGKFAVEHGRGEATKAAGKLQDQAAGVLEFIGGSVSPLPAKPEPAPRRASGAAPGTRSSSPASTAKAPGAARQAARKVAGVAATPVAQVVDTASLAIPDYDGLSASHVVNRLAGLSPAELEAVRLYETASRGRKTILSKVAQLQAS